MIEATLTKAEAVEQAVQICQNNLPATIFRSWDRSGYLTLSNMGGVGLPIMLELGPSPHSRDEITAALSQSEEKFADTARGKRHRYAPPTLYSDGLQWPK